MHHLKHQHILPVPALAWLPNLQYQRDQATHEPYPVIVYLPSYIETDTFLLRSHTINSRYLLEPTCYQDRM